MKYFGKILLALALLNGAFLHAEEAYELDWMKHYLIDDLANLSGPSLATDSNGDLFVSGAHEPSAYQGGYITKYSSEGSQIWTWEEKYVYPIKVKSDSPIAVDNSNDLFALSWDTISKFDGETGVLLWTEDAPVYRAHSIVIDSNGYLFIVSDTTITKLDSDATLIWIKQIGGKSLAIDSNDNLFVTGDTTAKYSNDGILIWSGQFGGNSIAIDSSDNLYITGTIEEYLDRDVYITKHSNDGALIWTEQFGTSLTDGGESIAIDSDDNLFVTGFTMGTFPGETNGGLCSSFQHSGTDAFIVKYSSDGVFIWLKQFGTLMDELATTVVAEKSDTLYIAGATMGILRDGGTDCCCDKVGEFIAKFIAPVTDPSEIINEAIDVISAMPDDSFSNPNKRKTLINKLNATLKMVDNGEYEEAVEKLQFDILPKIDGCTLRGEPDKQDWIIDCDDQKEVYVLIEKAIASIEALI